MPTMPRARQAGLIVRELEEETLIYDADADKAHCLNQTAALVWKHCDGTSSVTQICAVLSQSMETTIDEKVVWYALEQFNKDRLLEEKMESPAAFKIAGLSRRQMVRRLGLAAMVAIPVVTSIVVPTAVQAGTSCIPLGSPCSPTAPNCCPGLFCGGNPPRCNLG
jgi:Coenzyme PQQ synthesis protein D (PqqD)